MSLAVGNISIFYFQIFIFWLLVSVFKVIGLHVYCWIFVWQYFFGGFTYKCMCFWFHCLRSKMCMLFEILPILHHSIPLFFGHSFFISLIFPHAGSCISNLATPVELEWAGHCHACLCTALGGSQELDVTNKMYWTEVAFCFCWSWHFDCMSE